MISFSRLKSHYVQHGYLKRASCCVMMLEGQIVSSVLSTRLCRWEWSIGCGCCTFICPAKRKLSQSITAAKNHVLAEKKARAKKA